MSVTSTSAIRRLHLPAREKCLCACAVGTKLMAGEIHMSAVHPIRKPCPVCGKAMKRVRHETKGPSGFLRLPSLRQGSAARHHGAKVGVQPVETTDRNLVRRLPESVLTAEVLDLRPHAGQQKLRGSRRDAGSLQHPDFAFLRADLPRIRMSSLRIQSSFTARSGRPGRRRIS
jgi:hypothetical protein